MTTIAYHHKTGRILTDDADKVVTVENKVFFITSSVADFEPAIDDWLAGKTNRLLAHGFLIEGGRVWVWGNDPDDGPWKEPVKCNHALGSGRDYATAAMDFAQGAAGAIKYAMTRDSRTGGRLRTFDVKNGLEIHGK